MKDAHQKVFHLDDILLSLFWQPAKTHHYGYFEREVSLTQAFLSLGVSLPRDSACLAGTRLRLFMY